MARSSTARNGVPENSPAIGESASFQWRSWNQK